MSKQQSGGATLPNDFAHGGSSAKVAPRRMPPKAIGNNHNGSKRGQQGKG